MLPRAPKQPRRAARARGGRPSSRRGTHTGSAYRKHVIRYLFERPGRLLAIFLVMAVGAGTYAGLTSYVPDLYRSIDAYLDSYGMADLQISPTGTAPLSEDDVTLIRSTRRIADAYGAARATATFERDDSRGGDRTLRIAVEGTPASRLTTHAGINALHLIEGRLPRTAGEIVVSATDDPSLRHVRVGEKLSLTSIDGTPNPEAVIKERAFTVVGLVQSPEWVTESVGLTPAAGGTLTDYAFVRLDAFTNPDALSTIYAQVQGARAHNAFEDGYAGLVAGAAATVKEAAPALDQVQSSANGSESTEPGSSPGTSKGSPAASGDRLAWTILTREANPSFSLARASAERMQGITQVFPAFFLAVAVLVCLTTMTRAVEADRLEIGTLKALGFTPLAISVKYLLFSLLVSLAGAIAGVLVAAQVLPPVLWHAYDALFVALPFATPYLASPCLIGIGVAVAAALAATAAAMLKTLIEPARSLMQPAAPKPGRRVLLERAPFIWRRVNFSWKVTLRNIARYKKRGAMTIAGVAGCTALLLVGLGINDGIARFIETQYRDITVWNMTVLLAPDAASRQAADDALTSHGDGEAKSGISTFAFFTKTGAWAQNERADPADVPYAPTEAAASTGGGTEALMRAGSRPNNAKDRTSESSSDDDGTGVRGLIRDVNLYVPQNPSSLGTFFRTRDLATGKPLDLPSEGVLISQRLAEELLVQPGDAIDIGALDGSGSGGTVTVAGVYRNYIGHAVLMNAHTYQEVFGTPAIPNVALALGPASRTARDDLTRDLTGQAESGITGASYPEQESDNYRNLTDSLHGVTGIIILLSAILTATVIYALADINIDERRREIATLKVLGFRPREVERYVFREILILVGAGIALGLPFGTALSTFTMRTAEFDNVIFDRAILPPSYAIAIALILGFAIVVLLALKRRLRGVGMAESLKSVD